MLKKLRRLIGNVIRHRNPLDVAHYEVNLGLKEQLVIAQVSDVHIPRSAFSPKVIADAVAKEKPDIIVITGDMMDGRSKFHGPHLSQLIQLLKKIAPVYAISGNHERNNRKYFKIWRTMLKLSGVHYLDNAIHTFKKGEQRFTIVGIADYNPQKIDQLDLQFLEGLQSKQDDCILLLHHKPNIWRNIYPPHLPLPQLVFSGHAHGGQVMLPILNRGLIAPGEGIIPKYVNGLYAYPDGTMELISRGLASSTRPVRVNNRPHLPIVTLK